MIFSLIGRKPNEILRLKKSYGIKTQTKIKFKIYAEGESNNKNNE